MKNRRNHYRVLQVQPEAPLEVIRASYRTLMSRCGAHPDLGGGHEQAAMINEAWEVLRDPARRAAYDAELRRRSRPRRRDGTGGAGGEQAERPFARKPKQRAGSACPLCGAALSQPPRDDSRCARCSAPLTPVAAAAPAVDVHGRRGAARIGRSEPATMGVGWPASPVHVEVRDLSLGGLRISAPARVAAGKRVHVVSSAFEAVAEVVASHREGLRCALHARLLTIRFLRNTGVFLSSEA